MQDTCARPGCLRTVKDTERYRACSGVCQSILHQVENADRLCAALGDEGLTGQYRDEITAWSDAWSKIQELDYQLYQQAKSVGMQASAWEKLKTGKARTRRGPRNQVTPQQI